MGELSVTATALIDQFGRGHRDLRVSLTDRCSLRCTYCMPEEFADWIPGDHLLTVDEIVEVVSVAVSCGIRTIRLTGGEPLLNPYVVDIVRRIAGLPDAPEVSMTTSAPANSSQTSSSPKRRSVATSSPINGASRLPVGAPSTAQQNRNATTTSSPYLGTRGLRGRTTTGRRPCPGALRAWLRCQPVVAHNSSRIVPFSTWLARL